MSPHQLHRKALETQLGWRRHVVLQRLLAGAVTISYIAIVGFIVIRNLH